MFFRPHTDNKDFAILDAREPGRWRQTHESSPLNKTKNYSLNAVICIYNARYPEHWPFCQLKRKTSKSPKWNDDVDFVVVLYKDRAGA